MIELYGLFILIGIILATYTWVALTQRSTRSDIKWSIYSEIILTIYLSAIISGKILYIMLDFDWNHENLIESIQAGFSVLGASFGGIVAYSYLYKKYCKIYNIQKALYTLPVAFPILHIFGRIGCYFSGCCGGIIHILNHNIPLQIASSTWYLLCFLLGFFAFSKLKNKKNIFLSPITIYSIFVALERFIFDFFREDSVLIANTIMTKYQLISFFYLAITIAVTKSKQ